MNAMPNGPLSSKIRWWLTVVSVAVVCLVFAPPVLFALEPPPLKGRVNDYAGMLSASAAGALEVSLGELEQTDSTQIVVLTIPSLEGQPLEAISIRVVEQWKIGQKGFDNGALLLIAQKERKIRIEVGYGLEGSLTDLRAGQIIRNVIVPHFRAGNIDRGVLDGVQAMIQVVRGEFSAAENPPTGGGRKSSRHPGLFSLFIFLGLVNLLGRLRRPLGAAAGGVFFPIVGAIFFNLNWLWILAMIPLGIGAGFILSLFGAPLSFSGSPTSGRRAGGGWYIGSGGGFSSGGFGGFSGGGGGFGGGGASGGW